MPRMIGKRYLRYGVMLFLYTKRQACTIPCITL